MGEEQGEYDPPASVLTPSQRDYLAGERDPAPAAERAIRSRIRNRLRASVFDYSNIFHNLSFEDIDAAFTEPDELQPSVKLHHASAIGDIVALLFLVERESEFSESAPYPGWRMEDLVEGGVSRALNRLGESYESVDVSVTIERGEPLEELAEQELTELSHDQLRQLLFSGEITNDEFAQATMKMRDENE